MTTADNGRKLSKPINLTGTDAFFLTGWLRVLSVTQWSPSTVTKWLGFFSLSHRDTKYWSLTGFFNKLSKIDDKIRGFRNVGQLTIYRAGENDYPWIKKNHRRFDNWKGKSSMGHRQQLERMRRGTWKEICALFPLFFFSSLQRWRSQKKKRKKKVGALNRGSASFP